MLHDILGQRAEIASWFQARNESVLLIDAGGVLFNNVIEQSLFLQKTAEAFGADAGALRRCYSAEDVSFETNRTGVHQVLSACLQRAGGSNVPWHAFDRIDALYSQSVVLNRELFAVLRAMRGQGPTFVLASNEAQRWDELKHQKFGHLDLFDRIASSWKVQACKPSAEYFSRLDELLHPIGREHWRLLDDNPTVCAAARALGVAATRYCAGVSTMTSHGM